MAEEADEETGSKEPEAQAPVKCPPCDPGLPGWMATFSDLVTLLLTFFVLLLSFAKTETAKYEAALGSIRNAFGGNVLKHGEVIQRGKSPDDSPTMLESQDVIRPFPIEFLTMEGILDKYEINRESTEELNSMRDTLKLYELTENVYIEEMPEGIKVKIKDKIYFQKGSVKVKDINAAVLEKLVRMMRTEDWKIFIEGHASENEVSIDGKQDAMALSSLRGMVVTKLLINRGIKPSKITTLFYGDSRPDESFSNSTDSSEQLNRRVEFTIRKRDLRDHGNKVRAQ